MKLWLAQPYVLPLGWWKHLQTNYLGDTYHQEIFQTCTGSTLQPVIQQGNHQLAVLLSLGLCGRVDGGKNFVIEEKPPMQNATSVTSSKTRLENRPAYKTMHVQLMHTSGIWLVLLQIAKHTGKCGTEQHIGKTFWLPFKTPWTRANSVSQDMLAESYQKHWSKK